MSVPITERLSHAWARATGQKRIYSHVFERNVPTSVLGEFTGRHAYYHNVNHAHWLEARPFNGQPSGRFQLFECTHISHDHWGISGRSVFNESLIRMRQGTSVFNRDEVLALIAYHEKEWARAGLYQSQDQPFRKSIVNTPASTVRFG